VPIPLHAKDVKRGLLFQIIKQAGLRSDEFHRLLRG